MKKLMIMFFALVFAGSFLAKATAQEQNFVISTGEADQVPVIITTANQLAERFQDNLGEVQVVLYGKAVKELEHSKTVQEWLDAVEDDRIHFTACNIALEKTKTDKDKVPQEIEVVANAYTHILELKAEGYHGLEP